MAFDPTDSSRVRLATLAQLAQAGAWQLELAHDRPEHLLIWITRGQGLALLDGSRRGIGTHNALFIPARHLMALDLGRQSYGQALVIPHALGLTLPEVPLHLRIRDVTAQTELTALFEVLGREQNAARPLCQSAMACYAELATIWLRRQMTAGTLPETRQTAARKLSRAYSRRLVQNFANGESMADFAAALGVTPTHLTRVCRAETGKTAAALLTERTTHAARHLLGSTTVAVQDVARHLGFGSAAYFTRFVQQQTGKSPSALRREAQARAQPKSTTPPADGFRPAS